MMTLIIFFLAITGFRYWLLAANLSYLKAHGKSVPPEFAGVIESERLRTISEYAFENSRIGIFESVLSNLMLIVFLFGGLLGIYDHWIASLTDSFPVGGLLLRWAAASVLLNFDIGQTSPGLLGFSAQRRFVMAEIQQFCSRTVFPV